MFSNYDIEHVWLLMFFEDVMLGMLILSDILHIHASTLYEICFWNEKLQRGYYISVTSRADKKKCIFSQRTKTRRCIIIKFVTGRVNTYIALGLTSPLSSIAPNSCHHLHLYNKALQTWSKMVFLSRTV